jgi:hypothetical protein
MFIGVTAYVTKRKRDSSVLKVQIGDHIDIFVAQSSHIEAVAGSFATKQRIMS